MPGTYVVTDAAEPMLLGATFIVHDDDSVVIDYTDDDGAAHRARLQAYPLEQTEE